MSVHICGNAVMRKLFFAVTRPTRSQTEKKETHRRTSKNILRKHSDKEKAEEGGGRLEKKNKFLDLVDLLGAFHK